MPTVLHINEASTVAQLRFLYLAQLQQLAKEEPGLARHQRLRREKEQQLLDLREEALDAEESA